MTRLRTVRAIAKRWSLTSIVVAIAIGVVLRRLVAGLVTVPGRDGIQGLVWPLAGGIPAMVVAGAAGVLHEPPELLAGRPPVIQRGAFAALLAAGVVVGARLGGPTDLSPMRLRDDLALVGLGLGASIVLARATAWLAPAVVVVVTWFFGPGRVGSTAGWAVLLLPTGRNVPDLTCAIVALGGTALFMSGPPRGVRPDRAPG